MPLRSALRLSLALVLGLPLVEALFMWVGALLNAMGDAPAARVIGVLNTTVGVLWLASLVALIVVLALKSLNEPPPPPPPPPNSR